MSGYDGSDHEFSASEDDESDPQGFSDRELDDDEFEDEFDADEVWEEERDPGDIALESALALDVSDARSALLAAELGDWDEARRLSVAPVEAADPLALRTLREQVREAEERQAEYGFGPSWPGDEDGVDPVEAAQRRGMSEDDAMRTVDTVHGHEAGPGLVRTFLNDGESLREAYERAARAIDNTHHWYAQREPHTEASPDTAADDAAADDTAADDDIDDDAEQPAARGPTARALTEVGSPLEQARDALSFLSGTRDADRYEQLARWHDDDHGSREVERYGTHDAPGDDLGAGWDDGEALER